MPTIWLFAIVLVAAAAAFWLTRARAVASAGGDTRRMHSRPIYHALGGGLSVLVPGLLLLFGWTVLQPVLVDRAVTAAVPAEIVAEAASRGLVVADVRRVAEGLDAAIDAGVATPEAVARLSADDDVRGLLGRAGVALGSEVSPYVLSAAQALRETRAGLRVAMWGVVLAALAAALVFALRRAGADVRARNFVERGVMLLLVGAASIAILTTLGIVASMLFETLNFFSQYPASRFFFSTDWDPSFSGRGGGSELGILPLLWGTLYISVIALLVAVPVGLMAAIYLSEFAGRRMRAVAKPVIEVLAGIPTIVYGLFALITVGPLLRDVFAQPLGLGNSASSVMTAGIVMGIMLIPFVSSLSDDIINAVPQSMRDGSFGLGATHAETIRQVILPAALPGIVGAVLLAASRAIGETMIVVLGAGAAARLSLNPFEAMTTVTVKIVSQLTGDTDFASPETLVAFALGLTLFVITLGLNVLALIIVRRYREQYE